MDKELSPSVILGLSSSYNKSDAIDSYNSLTLWYKNNDLLTEEEKRSATNILNWAIENIIETFIEQTTFNTQFNRDFLENYMSSKNNYRFGYIEKII